MYAGVLFPRMASGHKRLKSLRPLYQVHASLIVVLTRGGSTARLVAKYRPSIPVLTVAVPVLTTDSLTWTCSGEQPARQCLVTRGLLPLLAEGSARATDTDTTDEIISVSHLICLQLAALVLHLLIAFLLYGASLCQALHLQSLMLQISKVMCCSGWQSNRYLPDGDKWSTDAVVGCVQRLLLWWRRSSSTARGVTPLSRFTGLGMPPSLRSWTSSEHPLGWSSSQG